MRGGCLKNGLANLRFSGEIKSRMGFASGLCTDGVAGVGAAIRGNGGRARIPGASHFNTAEEHYGLVNRSAGSD
jgi:hypothetical protein